MNVGRDQVAMIGGKAMSRQSEFMVQGAATSQWVVIVYGTISTAIASVRGTFASRAAAVDWARRNLNSFTQSWNYQQITSVR